MKNLVMIAALLSISLCAEAQTRRIAHRNHSGADGDKYDETMSSFGIPYHKQTPVVYPVITVYDTIHLESGMDSIVSHLDTIRFEVQPKRNVSRNNNVDDVRHLGVICSTLTTR